MNKDMISVTDELLFELYMLDLSFIEPIRINREYYLVVKTIKKYQFELGLVAKIPNEMLEKHSIGDIVDACSRKDEEYASLTSLLTFTPKEMLIMNILFSNFLNTNSKLTPEICFKDIEFYRKKVSSYKNVSINEITAESYRNIINSLVSKTFYLKTAPKFRKRDKQDYGVSNRDFIQDLLTIYDPYLISSNNLSFKYSFGEFGEVIKLSKRWRNIVPARCYHFSLNQAMYNVVACDIGRQIYILRGKREKAKRCDLSRFEYCGFNIGFEKYFEIMYGKYKKNMVRQRLAFYKTLIIILDAFVEDRLIDSYEFLVDYKDFIHGKGSDVKIYVY